MMLRKLAHALKMSLFRTLVRFAPGQNYMAFAGSGSAIDLYRHIAINGARKVLVVTDKSLVELGLTASAIATLAEEGVETVIFDEVLPDPTYAIVEKGAAVYRQNGCDTVLALGGGSSIDCTKGIGVAVSNPGAVRDYVGMGKVKLDIPPFYAIPTTAGTGSEATQGAVLSDDATHEKHVISGKPMLAKAVALDPDLMSGLPPSITAATGIDALTHAVEAYLSQLERNQSRELAAQAIVQIFKYLPTAVANGADIKARYAMVLAAYTAGKAINQVNVGNIHAIAHQLGAFYGIPHGVANAMVMPHVLECSLPECEPLMREMAQLIGRQSAQDFINAVRELIENSGIPATDSAIRSSDFPAIISRAIAEGDSYPVRHLMTDEEIGRMLKALMP